MTGANPSRLLRGARTRLPVERVRRLTQPTLPLFEELERFVVATALKIMRQLRIDWAWQCRLQFVDLFRNGAQPRHMRFCIAPAFLVVDNRKAFSESLR
jgi:hypothetical protein